MYELGAAVLLLCLLLGAGAGGVALQGSLNERHRSRETTDSVRLVITMLVTFAALVLGLLTTSVKDAFDAKGAVLREFATMLIQLDDTLREYGPEAAPARDILRSYTAAAIANTWSGEKPPEGDYYPRNLQPVAPGSLETRGLSAMLTRLDQAIQDLEPANAAHARLQTAARGELAVAQDRRWRLIEQLGPSVSWPYLLVLFLWLTIIFATFGLSSPRNWLVYAVILLCAFSVSSALYLILDLDTPLGGFVTISSSPLRDALAHMAAVPAP